MVSYEAEQDISRHEGTQLSAQEADKPSHPAAKSHTEVGNEKDGREPSDGHKPMSSISSNNVPKSVDESTNASEWSHQRLAIHDGKAEETKEESDEWLEMPAISEYDVYDDDGRLVARGSVEEKEEKISYNGLGGAAKGYTRVQIDEDAQSATSMDDNTAYLFKEPGKDLQDDDEEARNPIEQMQATKNLLTDGQRIAYVGVTRLAMIEMSNELEQLERTKKIKKEVDIAVESMKLWSQKIMVRLHSHMDISSAGMVVPKICSIFSGF